MDLSTIERDFTGREGGEWVDVPKLGDLRLKVRGLASDAVLAYRANLEKAVSIADREKDGSLKDAIKKAHWRDCLIEVVLLDWEGATMNGEPFPYSKERAKELLTNPKYELFADAVVWAANRADEGKDIIKEAVAKKPK